jgi:hypothetical protein
MPANALTQPTLVGSRLDMARAAATAIGFLVNGIANSLLFLHGEF